MRTWSRGNGAELRSGYAETLGSDGPEAAFSMRRFGARPEQIHAVRSFVGSAADTAGVDPGTAVLAASELATNVVLHARTAFEVTVATEPGHLRVELTDGSPVLPVVRWPGSGREHGRGMAIVDALADRWGAEPVVGGKVVWFEISRSGAREPHASARSVAKAVRHPS